jgi:hypothetical protein
MSAAALLDRLDRVKHTGPGRWIACCPAHEDKSPSLSIRELDDQTVLVKCFAGCGAIDVLDALGIEWSALFPRGSRQGARPSHSGIPAHDLLVILDHEITVAMLILLEIVERRKVNEAQVQRLIQAAARIGKARDMANPAKVDSRAA